MTEPLRTVVVGYGVGGRYFHAPFIAAEPSTALAGIVTRSAARREEVETDHPGVPVLDDLAAALPHADLVVISTPPETRRELVLQAVEAGVPVIGDKPFAPDADGARELRDAARDAGVPLGVFHNRRWDPDILTLKAVVDAGDVGDVWRFTSRFDLDQPGTLEATPSGGLLRDLGSHLVDQALWLFGSVGRVYGEFDWASASGVEVDAGFTLALSHRSGVRSLQSASKLNRATQRVLRVLGSAGSYRADTTDVQGTLLFQGRTPASEGDAWGYEPEAGWGELSTDVGQRVVPSARGSYQDYYGAVAHALQSGSRLPVTADDAMVTLAVLDAARLSDAEHRVVTLDDAVHAS